MESVLSIREKKETTKIHSLSRLVYISYLLLCLHPESIAQGGAPVSSSSHIATLLLSDTHAYRPTQLDTLIAGPYVQEAKRDLLEERLFFVGQEQHPLPSYCIHDILPVSEKYTDHPALSHPNVSFQEFVARRTATDVEWENIKDYLQTLFSTWGYGVSTVYALYQQISFFSQDRGSGSLVVVDKNYFMYLASLQQHYALDASESIKHFLSTQKQKAGIGSYVPSKKKKKKYRYPASEEIHRQGPTWETKKYGTKIQTALHYDHASAGKMLQDHGILLRSSALQQEEDGACPESGRTCIEGLTQETIQGLIFLKQAIEQKLGKPCIMRINGATEGYDHGQGHCIMAGTCEPGYSLREKDIKTHGAGYTVDIRLTGEAALVLEEILSTKKRNTTRLGTYVYISDFHGGGPAYHGHMSIFNENTYKLFRGEK